MIKKTITAAAALVACASTASAGGIERTNQVLGVLFEEGRYIELTFGNVNPQVSGTAIGVPVPGLNGAQSGNMAPSYWQFGAAYKQDIGERWSLAFVFDQPFGADVNYPAGTGYYAAGSTAELTSNALTAVAKYEIAERASVFGGLRYQVLGAKANIPFVTPVPGLTSPYNAAGGEDGGFGYLIGAAYEIPEIALRLALTYNSKIQHDLKTNETGTGAALTPMGPVLFPIDETSTTRVNTPQSVNLDFQTGLNEKTLLFAAVRWVNWSEFDITPAVFEQLTGGSLVSYDNDTVTYTLGLGRRINDNWAVSGRINYEPSNGGFTSNLGPTNGSLGATLAAQYTVGNTEISAGVSYVDIGDAQPQVAIPGAGRFAPSANFTNNYAIGAGVRIGYRF